jgi:hypothetical protein
MLRRLYLHVSKICKKIFRIYTSLFCLEQLRGKDLEHDLGVAVCIYMAMGFEIQVLLELLNDRWISDR